MLKNQTFSAVIGMALSLSSVYVLANEHLISQANKSFVVDGKSIEAITIKAGDSIRFQNEDPFFHNIFSLSELKAFDLGSYPKGQSKTVTFDKTGKAEVECAIHPQMFLEVKVE